MRNLLKILIFTGAFCAVTISSDAQAPHEEWRTLETEHYRIHFAADYEDWARYAASRLESVREIVGQEVGYLPQERTDVVVLDPVAVPNGSAWPFLTYPRMLLWTSPPGPESVIGHYGDWVELLTIHEQAHLAHLLRPSRNPMQRFLGGFLGLGPVTTRAPRWVIEGYATVIEGDLTGAGRPQSDLRAAILRKWAQQGRLPSYGQMASDSQSYLGMSMAYLTGSAFLEWLRDREGEESLRTVWARLTAKRSRNFEQAFSGVYGESPAELYARFRAELTHEALELEEQIETREGELWQDLSWQTGVPAVSPDGSRLAVVLRSRENPSRLVILKTGDDPEAIEKWNEEVEKLLEEDPDDVPAIRRKPLRRKPEHELVARNGANMFTPRWMADGSILFVQFEPDGDGVLHPDLFRWTPESGRVERLTHGADLREPSPISEREVVAVRRRHGRTSLVRVDLDSGAETNLTEPSLTTTVGWPRVDRSGRYVAFVRHDEGRWRLSILDLAGGAIEDLTLPELATTVAYPEWSSDETTLYASVGAAGFLDIWRFSPGEQTPPQPVTRSFGAALAPAWGGEGDDLYFLSLDAEGLDLRVIRPSALDPLVPLPTEISSLVPLRRPLRREPVEITVADPGPARPYGLGKLETRWLAGGGRTPSEQTWEAGLRLGDVVGRFDSLIVGSLSEGGPEGAAASAIWRGWPVAIEGRIFWFETEPADSPVEAGFPRPAAERTGGEAVLSWDRSWRNASFKIGGGILLDQVEPTGGEAIVAATDRHVAHLSLDYLRRLDFHPWHLGGSAAVDLGTGRIDEDDWSGWSGELGLVAGLEDHSVAGWYSRGAMDGDGLPFVVGGLPSTLTPRFDHLFRIWSPAIVAGSLSGEKHEGWGVELETELLPAIPFFEARRASEDLGDAPWVELAGLRVDFDLDPFPVLKVPGASLSLGGAYVLAGPRADEVEWWARLRWKLD